MKLIVRYRTPNGVVLLATGKYRKGENPLSSVCLERITLATKGTRTDLTPLIRSDLIDGILSMLADEAAHKAP